MTIGRELNRYGITPKGLRLLDPISVPKPLKSVLGLGHLGIKPSEKIILTLFEFDGPMTYYELRRKVLQEGITPQDFDQAFDTLLRQDYIV